MHHIEEIYCGFLQICSQQKYFSMIFIIEN